VLLAGAAAPARAAAGADRPDLRKASQEFVDSGFAGLQMRVRDRYGEWAGSAGVRKLGSPGKPPTNGRFWIGSSTKTFTATLVLQLVAEHRIGLDAPVARYLPEPGLDRRITVRMMLQHTSGLFNYTGDYYGTTYVPGIPGSGEEWVVNRFHTYRPEELVRLALSKPPLFAPGAGWSYSNTNYTLALLLIEKVTGHSYADELRRRILRPLDLRDTLVAGTRTELPGPHAHGYYRYPDSSGRWQVTDVTRQNLSLLAGAGDLISTTRDLQTFFSALMAGRLLPAHLLAEMRTPDPRSDAPYGRYGLGLWVQDTGPDCAGTIYSHDGSPPGGYGTLMYSTADGTKTLTASGTTGDAPIDLATVWPKALNRLIDQVYCTR